MTNTDLKFKLFSSEDPNKYTPDNISFSDFNRFNNEVANFISGQKDRDILNQITPRIESGSFILSVTLSAAIQANSLLADLNNISANKNLHTVDKTRISILETWQKRAVDKQDNQVNISSEEGENSFSTIKITSESIYNLNKTWVDVEDYFIGEIYNAGGKNRSNIHLTLLNTEDDIKISTSKYLLNHLNNLHLYDNVRVHARAKQNIITKEYKQIELLEIVKWENNIPADSMNKARNIVKTAFRNVGDISEWISEVRG